MKARVLFLIAVLGLCAAPLLAEDAAQSKSGGTTQTAKPAAAGEKAQPAVGSEKAKPALDAKAMEEIMMKAAMPGANHERLKKLEGQWNLTARWSMDPSQPMQEAKSTAVVRAIMDGRYFQEEVTGEMMGRPFNGVGITGYDNVLKKYVSSWIDNMGTGIMTSEGTADETGKLIQWTGQSADPTTGKLAKYRMVTRFVDDNKHVFEMYGPGPNGKEAKMMEITYERKM